MHCLEVLGFSLVVLMSSGQVVCAVDDAVLQRFGLGDEDVKSSKRRLAPSRKVFVLLGQGIRLLLSFRPGYMDVDLDLLVEGFHLLDDAIQANHFSFMALLSLCKNCSVSRPCFNKPSAVVSAMAKLFCDSVAEAWIALLMPAKPAVNPWISRIFGGTLSRHFCSSSAFFSVRPSVACTVRSSCSKLRSWSILRMKARSSWASLSKCNIWRLCTAAARPAG